MPSNFVPAFQVRSSGLSAIPTSLGDRHAGEDVSADGKLNHGAA
jgi:hypothetical protein